MRVLFFVMLIVVNQSCNQAKGPDVSNIKLDITTLRFEKDFFNIDSTKLASGYDQLMIKYPSFATDFLTVILNADPRWGADTLQQYLQGFSAAYRPVFDTAEKIFNNIEPYIHDIKKGLQHVRYYFPGYSLPSRIITYIGPLDGYGDILDKDAIIIGLHLHLGKSFSLYKTTWVQETYPDYISNRFEPDYIAVNAMNNIVNDLYPENVSDKTLILQMISKGKRLYLLQKFLPGEDEYKLIGYTKKQLEDSYAHEAAIWDLFVQNNFLQTQDINIIKNYVGESPKTQELGDASPGNIGSFTGWQIVKKFMERNPELTPAELMSTNEEVILQQAKYKP